MKDPLIRLEALMAMKDQLIAVLQIDNDRLRLRNRDLEDANLALTQRLVSTEPWWKHQDDSLTGDNNGTDHRRRT